MTHEPKKKRDWLDVVLLVLVFAVVVVHSTSWAFSLAWLGRLLGLGEKIVQKAPRMTVADILIWAAFGVLVLRMIITRDLRVLKALPVPAVVLVSLAVLSMLFAGNKLTAVADVVQYAEYFIAFTLVLASVLHAKSRMEKLTWVWLAVGLLLALGGLAHYLANARPAVDVASTFLNRNVLSGYLAMLLPLAWGLVLRYNHIAARLAWALFVLGGLVVMLAGGSWIAAALGILIVSVIHSRKLFPVVLAALLVLLIGVYPMLPRNNTAELLKSVQVFDEELKAGVRIEDPALVESARLSPRYVEWQAAMKFLTPGYHRNLGISRGRHIRQLLLGVGIGNYQQHIGRFYGTLPKPNENITEPDTQSLYLVLAVSTGIPAVLAFLWLLGAFLRRAAVGYAKTRDPFLRGLLLGCIGSLAALLVTNVFTSTLVHGTGPAMIIMFALAASGARLAEREPRETDRPGLY